MKKLLISLVLLFSMGYAKNLAAQTPALSDSEYTETKLASNDLNEVVFSDAIKGQFKINDKVRYILTVMAEGVVIAYFIPDKYAIGTISKIYDGGLIEVTWTKDKKSHLAPFELQKVNIEEGK